MTRTTLGLGAALIAISGFAYACGSADSASFGSANEKPGDGAGNPDAGSFRPGEAPPATGSLAPVDNAVIMVHAAKVESFRLCFKNEVDRQPQPDSQVMPEANVVGVERGSAVRIGPLRGAPGEVFLFEEPLLRHIYPAFGGEGQTCEQLLGSASQLSGIAISLGTIEKDLSSGVHLLVVRGCSKDTPLTKYSVAECGPSWTPEKGNLSVEQITLTGARRDSDKLPAQVVNLSQPLDTARAARDVVVSYGALAAPDNAQTLIVSNPKLFGAAQPAVPASLALDSTDVAIYDSVGFRVRLKAPGDAGASTTVLDQSLARVQKLSSPRDVPPSYYAAASNYALLLLGDPDAKLPDGGPDTDSRRNLHFLAVPVIDPNNDAGVDSGAGEPLDGSAPPQ